VLATSRQRRTSYGEAHVQMLNMFCADKIRWVLSLLLYSYKKFRKEKTSLPPSSLIPPLVRVCRGPTSVARNPLLTDSLRRSLGTAPRRLVRNPWDLLSLCRRRSRSPGPPIDLRSRSTVHRPLGHRRSSNR
jgi:hypothetical protein